LAPHYEGSPRYPKALRKEVKATETDARPTNKKEGDGPVEAK